MARVPVQLNSELNWEGVELQFDQSYQFKITTNPFREALHYFLKEEQFLKYLTRAFC
jgi:hypothetical protein